MLTTTMCVGLFYGIITEDTFKTSVLMVLSFYYGSKTKEGDNATQL